MNRTRLAYCISAKICDSDNEMFGWLLILILYLHLHTGYILFVSQYNLNNDRLGFVTILLESDI